MGWSDEWMPNARAALIELRGGISASGSDTTWRGDGQQAPSDALPRLSAVDMVAVIGVMTPGVVRALNSWAGTNPVAIPVSGIDSDGAATVAGLVGALGGMDAKTYLAGFCDAQRLRPEQRSATPGDLGDGDRTFGVWLTRSGETALYSFVRQLVADYTRVCDAAALAIQAAPAGGAQLPSDAVNLDNFWSAVGALASDLDVLHENPPVSVSIKDAALDALHRTETFIGSSAADVSQEVGEAAGNLAAGFFDNAGIISVAVAAIALFLFLK